MDDTSAVVPAGWVMTTIGAEALKVGSGSTPTGGSRVYRSHGRPFVRSQNVGWGSLLLDDIAHVDERTHRAMAATEVRDRDVLLNITGASIGRSAVADRRIAGGNVNQHVCIIRLGPSMDPHYVSAFLLSEPGQRQIDNFQAGGNRQGLNFQQIRSFLIPRPPLDEQRAIAGLLEDSARERVALERLLVKKRDLREALAVRLIDQAGRGGDGRQPWDAACLGKISEITIGRTPNRSEPRLWGRGRPWLTIADLRSKYVTESEEQITDLAASAIRVIPAGTLLMSFKLTIGRVAIAGRDLYTNEAICAIRSPEANRDFLYHTLPRVDFAAFGQQAVKGVTLNKESLSAIQVRLPPRPDQDAIAAALNDADREIDGLESRLAKARDLSIGLAQDLLSGRRRLV
jgi:type I restriction enzyme S subunit